MTFENKFIQLFMLTIQGFFSKFLMGWGGGLKIINLCWSASELVVDGGKGGGGSGKIPTNANP